MTTDEASHSNSSTLKPAITCCSAGPRFITTRSCRRPTTNTSRLYGRERGCTLTPPNHPSRGTKPTSWRPPTSTSWPRPERPHLPGLKEFHCQSERISVEEIRELTILRTPQQVDQRRVDQAINRTRGLDRRAINRARSASQMGGRRTFCEGFRDWIRQWNLSPTIRLNLST